jgi:putative hydrolase of the HAD superfamily
VEDSKIQAIIFDCFGVLTVDMWQSFIDTLPDGVDEEAASEINRAYDAGMIDKIEFLKRVEEVTGKEPHVLEEFQGEVTKNITLLDYIRELRNKGYKIGLLSNIASNWIRDSLLSEKEQALFDEMTLSFEVGMAKPDPRIFMLVCDRLRVSPHEAVFIDDVDRYCEAAKAEGLRAVVYADFKQMKSELERILNEK